MHMLRYVAGRALRCALLCSAEMGLRPQKERVKAIAAGGSKHIKTIQNQT